jgi:phage-related protein (TIGR01555 family)
LKVQGLREILAGGGAMLNALNANFDMIRAMQQAEGLTLIDARDDFQTHQYAFQGLSDMLLQFGQQIAGAFQVPLVRFFGTSPVGMNSTGESDFRLYYDGIGREQERKRAALARLFKVMYRSRIGENPWKSFGFNFRPLWKVSRAEKAQIGQQKTATILSTLEAAVIGRKTALQELRQQSAETGLFSNITDEMIDEADEDPPPPSEAIEAGKQAAGAEGGKGTKPKPDDFEGKPDALGA